MTDPEDPRLESLMNSVSPEVTILGYPDDEGIRLNGGRVGAASGPTEIRRWLKRMTPHPERRLRAIKDQGDLDVSTPLTERHAAATKHVAEALLKGRVLTFGGGNDYAYPDGLAFLKQFKDAKPLIVNVDAHFDVRPLDKGLTSGTPFYRLLESGIPFDFVEFGIQPQCNSKAHREYVRAKNGLILDMEDYLTSGVSLLEWSSRALGELLLKSRPVFLAIDIDAFALPYATGASASWPLGLQPQDFYPVFRTWLKRWDVRALGIYEVSPPLETNGSAAKLAALLAHGFLHDV